MPRTGKNSKSYLKGEAEEFLRPQKETVKAERDDSVFMYLIACQRERREQRRSAVPGSRTGTSQSFKESSIQRLFCGSLGER